MKRILLIMILFTLLIVSCTSHKSMTSEATYWMNRCKYAEQMLELVDKHDENFYMDVLMETDAYYNWLEYAGIDR